VLAGLGFVNALAAARSDEQCDHASMWTRSSDRTAIDLHRSLSGVTVPPADVWSALREHRTPLVIGPATVSALDDTALALTVVFHAARHGRHVPKPLADLTRALERFDESTLEGAAALAGRLEALPLFVAGLRLVPAGAAWARSLGRDVRIPDATAVRALTRVRGIDTLELLRGAPGWRRLLVLVQRTFPSRAALRVSMPLARRGRLGLLAAYAVRPLWLAVRLPAAARAWRTAVRAWSDQPAGRGS
jgi:hypothetical protein